MVTLAGKASDTNVLQQKIYGTNMLQLCKGTGQSGTERQNKSSQNIWFK